MENGDSHRGLVDVYNYQAHIDLIDRLRSGGRWDELRKARQHFHSLFMLPEVLWLEWLEDEQRLATTMSVDPESKTRLLVLAEQSIQDYLSIDLLKRFLSLTNKDGLRRAFEVSVFYFGHHLSKGPELWKMYLDFEAEQPDSRAEAVAKQIPHLDPDMMAFEAKLDRPDCSQKVYQKYIKSELKKPEINVDLIRTIYEREIAQFPFEPSLWLEYLAFCKAHIKIGGVLEQISKRATRDCPRSPQIWSAYLLVREKASDSLSSLGDIFNQAEIACAISLDNAVELYMTWCDINRRYSNRRQDSNYRCNDHFFHDLIDRLKQQFPPGDPLCRLERYLSQLYFSLGQFAQSTTMWETIVREHPDKSSFWLEFIQMEKGLRAFDQCSQHFKLACAAVSDNPQLIFDEWTLFERQFGTLESLDLAEEHVQARIKLLTSNRRTGKRKKPQVTESLKRLRIRPAPVAVQLPLDPQKSVFISNLSFDLTEEQLSAFLAQHIGTVVEIRLGRKASGKSRGIAEAEFETTSLAQKALEYDRTRLDGRPIFISPYQPVGRSARKPAVAFPRNRDPKTLFVSKLPHEASQETLQTTFAKYPGLVDIRLVTNKAGRFRGCAYVQFDTEAHAAAALNENGTLVGDRLISVLVSDPSLGPKGLRPSAALKTNQDFRRALGLL